MAQSIVVIHDPSASQATFVEITFALNIALAAFKKFGTYIGSRFDESLAGCVAGCMTAEPDKVEHEDRISQFKSEIQKIKSKHARFQKDMCKKASALSFAMSVLCLVVLYFDYLEVLGHWLAILISPLPLYILCSVLLYLWFVAWAKLTKQQYVAFIQKFEKRPSDEIQEGLDSLGEDEDKDENKDKKKGDDEDNNEET